MTSTRPMCIRRGRRQFTLMEWLNRVRFTLIELLVVIVIIAILVSMLLPALSNAKHSARSLACKKKLKEMGVAMTMYRLDFDNWVPPMRDGVSPQGATCQQTYDWVYRINLYFGLDVQSTQFGPGLNGTQPGTNPFFCDAEEGRTFPDNYLSSFWIGDCWGARSTYNMNGGLGIQAGIGDARYDMTQTVVSPSDTLLYIDGKQEHRIDFSFWGFYKTRHGPNVSRANLVYVDGHVAFVTHGEMTALGGQQNDPFWSADF